METTFCDQNYSDYLHSKSVLNIFLISKGLSDFERGSPSAKY